MKYFVYFLIIFNVVALLISQLTNGHRQTKYKVSINYGSGLPVTLDEVENFSNY